MASFSLDSNQKIFGYLNLNVFRKWNWQSISLKINENHKSNLTHGHAIYLMFVINDSCVIEVIEAFSVIGSGVGMQLMFLQPEKVPPAIQCLDVSIMNYSRRYYLQIFPRK